MHTTYFKSDISGIKYPIKEKVNLQSVRAGIFKLIKNDYPDIDESKNISFIELDEYRQKYIEISVKDEIENISSLEIDVLEKIKNQELISNNIDSNPNYQRTMGQRIADKVASFGGSWKFIISFFLFITLWIALNITALFFKSFDPFPFILLNLILSCLAAIQAPIIMMSQNRVEDRDRLRAREDYKINLKSEIEIQALHEKIDHLIINQQQKLFEIQNIQIEMLNEINVNLNEIKQGQGTKRN